MVCASGGGVGYVIPVVERSGTAPEIIKEYPQLKRNDIQVALSYDIETG